MRAPTLRVVGIILFLTLLSAVNLRLSQGLVSGLLGRTGQDSSAASVTDSSAAVIPGASVIALKTSFGITTLRQIDENGYSIFPQLQVDLSYTFAVAAPGSRNGT